MAAKKKMVPVTSVTPASKVKAVSKAQQARTRNLVTGIASATPVGRVAKTAATAAKAISKVRAGGVGREGASKVATKIGDKLSGASSKRVQKKLDDIARKDWKDTAQRNLDMTGEEAYIWSKHPAMVSRKGFEKGVNKGKTVTDRQSVRYRKAEDRQAAKANTRGLKAANKPTKASKTFEGNNKKISVEVRRGVLKNTPPARPNRERGGSLKTLRRQGKTGK